MSKTEKVYVAKEIGMPGYCAMCSADHDFRKEAAKAVAKWVRSGLEVSLIPQDEAVAGIKEYLAAKKSRKEGVLR